jgi:hypothetical protein
MDVGLVVKPEVLPAEIVNKLHINAIFFIGMKVFQVAININLVDCIWHTYMQVSKSGCAENKILQKSQNVQIAKPRGNSADLTQAGGTHPGAQGFTQFRTEKFTIEIQ